VLQKCTKIMLSHWNNKLLLILLTDVRDVELLPYEKFYIMFQKDVFSISIQVQCSCAEDGEHFKLHV
jgi:hypothetical protein